MNSPSYSKLYRPSSPVLASVESRIHSKFFELKDIPAPSQNITGYREIDQRAVELTKNIIDEFSQFKSLNGTAPKVNIVERFDASQVKIACTCEDGKLLSAVMSPPTYLDWESGICEGEKTYINNKTDRLIATMEHFGMMLAILDREAEIHLILPDENVKEGVFTRDVAFSIDGKFFKANLAKPERRHESARIVGGVEPPAEVIIEGGNIVLGSDFLFIGINDRTNLEAVEWLKGHVDREIITFNMSKENPKVLHLDCVFCPIEKRNGNQSLAFTYAAGFENKADVETIRKIYGRTQEVGEHDYRLLGPNVLKIDSHSYIVNQGAHRITNILRANGIESTELSFGEITKAEGAWRCTFAATSRNGHSEFG
jgi:N-dimethylarginine dimethylaminohydrolase